MKEKERQMNKKARILKRQKIEIREKEQEQDRVYKKGAEKIPLFLKLSG